MLRHQLLGVAVLVFAVLHAHAMPDRRRMEPAVVPGTSDHWVATARATGPVAFFLVFKSSDAQRRRLESTLWAVSDPDSVDYGNHLSQEAVDAIVAPSASALDAVTAWLRASGMATDGLSRRLIGDVLPLELDAAVAERLFETRLHAYAERERPSAPAIVRASAHYSLPAAVAKFVLLVSDLHGFPAPLRSGGEGEEVEDEKVEGADETAARTAKPAAADAWPTDCGKCDEGLFGKHVTPAVLAQRYGLPLDQRTPVGHAGSIGIAEFQGVFYDQRDLDGYASTCGLPPINLTLIGANRPRSCSIPIVIKPDLCTEALLDIQVIKGIGPSLPLTDVSSKGYSIVGWATQLQGLPNGSLPLVQSVSYGNDEKQQPSDEFIEAVNTQLMKLGVRGLSVFFASGDGGVFGRSGSGRRFAAGFPASSPYVTAVGGTDFVAKNDIGSGEKAWSGSGGGFSYHFSPPPYQQAAVATYLASNATKLPDPSKYNASGRGFPDVAALGGAQNKYCIYSQGKNKEAYGTSAATPVIAAMVAKLNVLRSSKGKPPLGFVNPLFYKHPEAFQDVTQGCNAGKVVNGCKKGIGFPAAVGWDATTGLGTPDWDKLAALM